MRQFRIVAVLSKNAPTSYRVQEKLWWRWFDCTIPAPDGHPTRKLVFHDAKSALAWIGEGRQPCRVVIHNITLL